MDFQSHRVWYDGRQRTVPAHDPEMRHSHTSQSKRFDGHKVALAVDVESQMITAVEVLPGNAPDHERALELVEESEENAQVEVEETIGDCAFGDGLTRQEFADAGRKRPKQRHFPKMARGRSSFLFISLASWARSEL